MLTLVAMIAFHLTPPVGATPYKAPQLAASKKIVALAFGAGNSIYVATSKDQGSSFSAPVKVTAAEVLPLSRHRGPRVAVTNGAIVVTAVTGNSLASGPHAHGLASDGDLYAWRSTDGGASWSKGASINDVAGSAREGLHTLASDGHGKLFAAWLDLRGEGTPLYGAFSYDNGATWSKNQLLYKSPGETICQCCHPSASFAKDGTLDVMWRNDVADARDFYIMRAKPGKSFGAPEKLGQGTWKINACPMDGGGLTHEGSTAITAWRREGELFLAVPGKPEQKIGEGKDVTVAAAGARVFAAWVAGDQLVEWSDGKTRIVADSATMPNMIGLLDGQALMAWEENGGIAVRKLP
jgi:hypothetical protein